MQPLGCLLGTAALTGIGFVLSGDYGTRHIYQDEKQKDHHFVCELGKMAEVVDRVTLCKDKFIFSS